MLVELHLLEGVVVFIEGSGASGLGQVTSLSSSGQNSLPYLVVAKTCPLWLAEKQRWWNDLIHITVPSGVPTSWVVFTAA